MFVYSIGQSVFHRFMRKNLGTLLWNWGFLCHRVSQQHFLDASHIKQCNQSTKADRCWYCDVVSSFVFIFEEDFKLFWDHLILRCFSRVSWWNFLGPLVTMLDKNTWFRINLSESITQACVWAWLLSRLKLKIRLISVCVYQLRLAHLKLATQKCELFF